MTNNDFKFIEWAEKGIFVSIRHKFLYNPDITIWVSDISRMSII